MLCSVWRGPQGRPTPERKPADSGTPRPQAGAEASLLASGFFITWVAPCLSTPSSPRLHLLPSSLLLSPLLQGLSSSPTGLCEISSHVDCGAGSIRKGQPEIPSRSLCSSVWHIKAQTSLSPANMVASRSISSRHNLPAKSVFHIIDFLPGEKEIRKRSMGHKIPACHLCAFLFPIHLPYTLCHLFWGSGPYRLC